MIKMKKSIAFVASLFMLGSCSTDFDIIAPYQEYTIVYGLLDQSETIHYIKVNKSFLGNGNAYDYAAVKDSSEYTKVEGTVERWLNGTLQQTFYLNDTTISNKDSGLFYYPDQTVYYFTASNLDQDSEYRLNLNINEGKKMVSGSTNLVKNVAVNNIVSNPVFKINLSGAQLNTYQDYTVDFSTSENGRKFDTWIQFRFDEYTATDTTKKVIKWKIASHTAISTSGGENVDAVISGEGFFSQVQKQVPIDAAVLKRVPRAVDIIIVGANEDLATYMDVNAPSTGLIQEKPSFTNLTDDGADPSTIGIFASRYSKSIKNKILHENSLKELAQGQYTYQLGFCADSLVYGSYSFFCP